MSNSLPEQSVDMAVFKVRTCNIKEVADQPISKDLEATIEDAEAATAVLINDSFMTYLHVG